VPKIYSLWFVATVQINIVLTHHVAEMPLKVTVENWIKEHFSAADVIARVIAKKFYYLERGNFNVIEIHKAAEAKM